MSTLSTVASFRISGLRLLAHWTVAWSEHVEHKPLTHADAAILIGTIQAAFWKQANRNPTTTEWVRSILARRPIILIATNKAYLNMFQTWATYYYAMNRDCDAALGEWSYDIGWRFGLWGLATTFDVPHDLTTEAKITEYVKSIAPQRRSWWQKLVSYIYQ